MKKSYAWIAVALVLGFLGAPGVSGQPAIGAAAPQFSLPSVEGKVHALADFRGSYVVLEWTNYDCPWVVKHYVSKNMQTLQRTWREKGVAWLTVCSSAPGKQGNFTQEVWQRRMKDWDVAPTAVLLDELGNVGRMYAATRTPHMAVIHPEGQLIYLGGIDDDRSRGTDNIAQARNFVAQALTQAMAGEAVTTPTAPSYGCTVKY